MSTHQNVTQEFHFEATLTPEPGAGYVQGGSGSTVITSKTLETTQRRLTGVWVNKPCHAQKETHPQKKADSRVLTWKGIHNILSETSQTTETYNCTSFYKELNVYVHRWAFGNSDTPILRDFFWAVGLKGGKMEELCFFHFPLPHCLRVCYFCNQTTLAVLPRVGKD